LLPRESSTGPMPVTNTCTTDGDTRFTSVWIEALNPRRGSGRSSAAAGAAAGRRRASDAVTRRREWALDMLGAGCRARATSHVCHTTIRHEGTARDATTRRRHTFVTVECRSHAVSSMKGSAVLDQARSTLRCDLFPLQMPNRLLAFLSSNCFPPHKFLTPGNLLSGHRARRAWRIIDEQHFGRIALRELSWFWIGIAVSVPGLLGALVAYPIWLKSQPILGNLAGTAVIFGAAIALIGREHLELENAAQQCLAQGFVCWPVPSAFSRYAIYAFIALVEVMILFTVSLRVEHKVRRRGYAPEWR